MRQSGLSPSSQTQEHCNPRAASSRRDGALGRDAEARSAAWRGRSASTCPDQKCFHLLRRGTHNGWPLSEGQQLILLASHPSPRPPGAPAHTVAGSELMGSPGGRRDIGLKAGYPLGT